MRVQALKCLAICESKIYKTANVPSVRLLRTVNANVGI